MGKINTHTFSIVCTIILLAICHSCGSDYTEKLGSGYTYRNEGGPIIDILHEQPSKGGEIPSTVVSYDYDRNFIVAKQKPKLPQDPLYCKEYKYSSGDSAFYYWLIVKKEQKVFGPLDIDQFNQKRKEYNVSKSLTLK